MTSYTRRGLIALGAAALAVPLARQGHAASHAAAHTVTISGFAFSPANLTIAQGDKVAFVNQDAAPHTATGSGFDTGRLRRGNKAVVSFDQKGQFTYICKFHPGMKGRITVK